MNTKVVVRIEINTLTKEDGSLNKRKVERLAMVLVNLQNSGKQVVVVSSGAIALGSRKLGLKEIPTTLIAQQTAAAIGQAELINMYQQFFGEYNQVVAQVLLTHDVMDNQERSNNATNTFNRLIQMNIIPIVNENDSISTYDIMHDDNYSLAVKVADLIEANIILVKLEDNNKFVIVQRGSNKTQKINEENVFEYVEKLIQENNEVDDIASFPLSIKEFC